MQVRSALSVSCSAGGVNPATGLTRLGVREAEVVAVSLNSPLRIPGFSLPSLMGCQVKPNTEALVRESRQLWQFNVLFSIKEWLSTNRPSGYSQIVESCSTRGGHR